MILRHQAARAARFTTIWTALVTLGMFLVELTALAQQPATGPIAANPTSEPQESSEGPAAPAEAPVTPVLAATTPEPGTEAVVEGSSAKVDAGVASTTGTEEGTSSEESAAIDADAEAAAILQQLEGQGSDNVEVDAAGYRVNFYGFADATYKVQLDKKEAEKTLYSRPTFFVGNLNAYMTADLGDQWRTMAEVRFMFLPHGNVDLGSGEKTDTTVADYADFDRPLQWGGIKIERAWLEHTIDPLLTVRAGYWLTPYGIWNVDHASPVIIPIIRPYVIGDQLFPQYQSGIQAYGALHFDTTQIGYHLTLSNGRGFASAMRDLDNNKALGGRVFVKSDTPLAIVTVGASGYRGRYTNRNEGLFDKSIIERYDEFALGGDLKVEIGKFLLQSEILSNERGYIDGARPTVGLAGPQGLAADQHRWGVYGLTGYRLPWLDTMPYVHSEYNTGYVNPGFPQSSAAVAMGLNVQPSPRVVLKLEYTYVWFPGPAAPVPLKRFQYLSTQAAWSF